MWLPQRCAMIWMTLKAPTLRQRLINQSSHLLVASWRRLHFLVPQSRAHNRILNAGPDLSEFGEGPQLSFMLKTHQTAFLRTIRISHLESTKNSGRNPKNRLDVFLPLQQLARQGSVRAACDDSKPGANKTTASIWKRSVLCSSHFANVRVAPRSWPFYFRLHHRGSRTDKSLSLHPSGPGGCLETVEGNVHIAECIWPSP